MELNPFYNFNWIIEGRLAVSSYPEPKDIARVYKEGIRAIVSLATPKLDKELIDKLEIEYLYIPVEDFSIPDFESIRKFIIWTDFMIKHNKPVLIHCLAGRGRSLTLAALYLVYLGGEPDKIIEKLRQLVSGAIETREQENLIYEFSSLKDIFQYEYTYFDHFKLLVETLRKRCPWDKEQTHKTLIKPLIEEAYEVAHTILENKRDELRKELGDLLLQIIFHSVLSEENNEFKLIDIVSSIDKKLTSRHPHVFSDKKLDESEKVLEQWDILKEKEGKIKSHIDAIKLFSSLEVAFLYQEKARQKGFDFQNTEQVISKIEEETRELKSILEKKEKIEPFKDTEFKREIENEVGDLFFSLLNLSRFLEINPIKSLTESVTKFEKRFSYIEKKLKEKGKTIEEETFENLDKLWEEAKNKTEKPEK